MHLNKIFHGVVRAFLITTPGNEPITCITDLANSMSLKLSGNWTRGALCDFLNEMGSSK